MPELLHLDDGVDIPAPGDGSVVRYSADAVQDVADFFSLLVYGQNEWAGQPFKLLPWEQNAIKNFYGVQVQDDGGLWVRYRRFLYTELPKKTAKASWQLGWGFTICSAMGKQGHM